MLFSFVVCIPLRHTFQSDKRSLGERERRERAREERERERRERESAHLPSVKSDSCVHCLLCERDVPLFHNELHRPSSTLPLRCLASLVVLLFLFQNMFRLISGSTSVRYHFIWRRESFQSQNCITFASIQMRFLWICISTRRLFTFSRIPQAFSCHFCLIPGLLPLYNAYF